MPELASALDDNDHEVELRIDLSTKGLKVYLVGGSGALGTVAQGEPQSDASKAWKVRLFGASAALIGQLARAASLPVTLSTEDAAKVPSLGQAAKSGSVPVVLPTDQTVAIDWGAASTAASDLLQILTYLAAISGQLPATLGPHTPSSSLSVVAAQSAPWAWNLPVTSTPRALITAWDDGVAYAIGEIVANDSGKVYQCITAGTSAGSGGPTGTSSDITDNTAHWKYIAAAVPTFKGSLVLQVLSTSANTIRYSCLDSTLAAGGKEIPIGTDGDAILFGDATSIFVHSTGTATATVVAYT